MNRRSLEGRLAGVQITVTGLSLVALAGLTLALTTFLMRREQDARLESVVARTVASLEREIQEGGNVSEWLKEDLKELPPEGVQLLVFDGTGARVGVAGTGPDLTLPAERGCSSIREGWRGCSGETGRYTVLAARSEAAEGATKRLVLFSVAAVAALLAALTVILSRTAALLALSPLTRITASVARIEPGTGVRIEGMTGLDELDLLARRFNDLLGRVDDALARERRFAAEASHELKTPLTVLRGEIESLLGYGGEVGAASARALGSVDGLVKIVEALLNLSRVQAAFDPSLLGTVNLCDLVREQVSRVASSLAYAGRAIEVESPDEQLVAADERLVGIAFSNVLENALKYSAADALVRVWVRPDADRVVITVEDNGAGIPAEAHREIFEPFIRGRQVRANVPGEGLGLPLARAVARAHGGELLLTVSGPEGSRFDLVLPALRLPSA